MQRYSAIALFCEDIREERNGGTSLVGVTSDNIGVPAFPGSMPKLGIFIRLNFNPDDQLKNIMPRLTFPDGHSVDFNSVGEAEIERAKREAIEKDSPLAGIVFRLLALNFGVPSKGRLLLDLVIDGEPQLCGSLNFELAKDSA